MDHPIHNHMERSIHNVKTGFATRFIDELEVGTVNVCEVPGYRTEMCRSEASRSSLTHPLV
jgi:hypothetical protein